MFSTQKKTEMFSISVAMTQGAGVDSDELIIGIIENELLSLSCRSSHVVKVSLCGFLIGC